MRADADQCAESLIAHRAARGARGWRRDAWAAMRTGHAGCCPGAKPTARDDVRSSAHGPRGPQHKEAADGGAEIPERPARRCAPEPFIDGAAAPRAAPTAAQRSAERAPERARSVLAPKPRRRPPAPRRPMPATARKRHDDGSCPRGKSRPAAPLGAPALRL